jgi:hypothetical protein
VGGFEYGIRYPDTPPGEALGPFPTEALARRWVAEEPVRILASRPAGTDDPWREVKES